MWVKQHIYRNNGLTGVRDEEGLGGGCGGEEGEKRKWW